MNPHDENQASEKQTTPEVETHPDLDSREGKLFQKFLTNGDSFAAACLKAGVSKTVGNVWISEIQDGREYAEDITARKLQGSIALAIQCLEDAAVGAEDDKARVMAATNLIRLRMDFMRLAAKRVVKPKDPLNGQNSIFDF